MMLEVTVLGTSHRPKWLPPDREKTEPIRGNGQELAHLSRRRSKPAPEEARRAIISDRPYSMTPESAGIHTSRRLRRGRDAKGPYRGKSAWAPTSLCARL